MIAEAITAFVVNGHAVNPDRAPLAGAAIVLTCSHAVAQATTAADGAFSLSAPSKPPCTIGATKAGYESLRGEPVFASVGAKVDLTLMMQPRSASSLTVLGTVSATGTARVSTAAGATATIRANDLATYGIEGFVGALAAEPAVGIPRPAGGSAGAPAVISLRGPDPSETLVEIDGHPVNNGGVGDYDLTLLDSSGFSEVQVVYGIGPSSLVGVNTLGGAVNFRTIDPTGPPRSLVRVSIGSFGTASETVQATGQSQRVGYALSVHRYTAQGETNSYPIVDRATGASAFLGSSIAASSELTKVRYDFGTGRGFVQATYRAGASYRDESAALSTPVGRALPGSAFASFAGSNLQTVAPAFGIDMQLPVGAAQGALLTLRHQSSMVDQSVTGPASDFSPFFLNSRDALTDDVLQYDVPNADGLFTAVARVLAERLVAPGAFSLGAPVQSDTQRSFLVRQLWSPTAHLHYTAATYLSSFTTFGTSIDPRAAIVWTPNGSSAVRASIGTTFQAPLLTQRFVPSPLPSPDDQGLIHVGNPNLRADHATEYEIGVEQLLGAKRKTHLALDAYRTNLRTPALDFIPDQRPGLAYPINASNAVYRGFNLGADVRMGEHVTVHGAFGASSAFLMSVPPGFADPENPILAPYRQFLGVPLQRGHLALDDALGGGLSWRLETDFESANNELNRPAYLVVDAGVSYKRGHTTFALAQTNATGVYADRFSLPGAGTTPGTNAYSLQGPAVTLTATTSL